VEENSNRLQQYSRNQMKKNLSTRTAVFPTIILSLLLLGLTGCESYQYNSTPSALAGKTDGTKLTNASAPSEAMTLREGDVLKISFPGSPSLDATQTIRRDGKITLQLAGEITAAGITPAELEKQIAKAYGSQLISKEVSVTVVSSTIPVFVSGSVLRPQKVVADHPISALEAIMEAGGFDYAKANLKDVRVIRYENGRQHTYVLNLKDAMQGKQTDPFYLKPFDIVYVPERFSMF
jgi:polysaccharide biosynthesis/export protein